MVRKSLLLILALAGFASADTGFPSTIKVTETDNSPSCIAGQIKFGAGQVSCSGQTATVTITGGGGGVGGTINQANQYSVGYYSGVSTTIISGLAPGTSGQVLTTGGASVSPFWSTVTSGSGMSPNATYYIQVRDTLQSGATFYVSSGTVANSLTVGGPIIGNGAYLRNVPIMSPSATAPFPGATPGYLDITEYYNTATGATGGFRVAGTQTLSRQGGMIVVGNAGSGTAASSGLCVGDSSCSNIDAGGLRSTVIGSVAGQADMAEDNTCIGYNACGDNLTNRQTLIGAFAGASLTTGPSNTAIGWDTMPLATTAEANVCIGNNACDLLTTGSENMVVGNTAGADITTGVRNLCMGGGTGSVQSCTGIITGSSNTAVGNGSLGNILYAGTESANTTIGYKAAVGIGVNNAVAIGYNSVATSSNTMMLGGIGNDGVRVIMTTMTVSSGTVSGQLSVGSIKFPDGTVQITSAPASGSGSGGSGIVSPGTFTWTNNYGMSLSTLAVSTISVAGAGLLSATQNNLSGLLVVSTAPTGVTVGHMAVFGSSWTIVDGGVPGTGSGGSGIVSPGTFTWTNSYGLSLSTLAVSSNAYVTSGTTFYANGMMVQSISTAAYAGVYFETVTSTINVGWLKLADSYGNSGEFLKSNGAGAKPTWGVAGGGGGSSSLAVANNIVTYTGPNVSSPTAILNFDTATMLVTLAGSATSFVELKSSSVTLQGNTLGGDVTGTLGAMVVGDDSHSHTGATLSGIDISADTNLAATQPVVLTNDTLGLTLISLSTGVVGTLPVGNGGTGLTSAQTATQPIVYNSATGVFGATPISLSTGIVGVLPAANFPAQVPFSVLPTTIAYITSTQTFSGYHNFVGSSTFTGSVWVSTSILLSGSIGTNGQVLTTGGPGTVPTWTTPTGGSGYATIQDEASNLTQRTTVNFTGTGVSCADDAGNTRTNCTISAGAASAGGSDGNIQFNSGGSLAGLQGSSISGNTIIISTGGINSYKVVLSSTEVNIGSFTVNSGMVAFNNVSTMTSTAQWDQNAAFTFGGKQGQTGQVIQSSGSTLAPMWGPTFTLLRTTSTLTVTGNTNVKVPQLEMTLLANSTYQIECAVVFQTTATALGVRGGVFTSAGSTGTYTIDIPVAADGTAGLFSGWISSAGDSVTGTAVQAANTNYVMHVYGNITVGTAGNFYIMNAGEGGTGSMTVRQGSTCSVIGLTP